MVVEHKLELLDKMIDLTKERMRTKVALRF